MGTAKGILPEEAIKIVATWAPSRGIIDPTYKVDEPRPGRQTVVVHRLDKDNALSSSWAVHGLLVIEELRHKQP